MMNEIGIRLTHTTILRWVQHYTPEFKKRRYARPVSDSWQMDATLWSAKIPSEPAG